MISPTDPDVAFGWHPEMGVAAAVADARPYLDEVLREHGFRHSSSLDVYLLPAGTSYEAAIRSTAAASRRFQEAHITVAADPRLATIRPATHLGTKADGPSHLRQGVDVAHILEKIHERHGSSDSAHGSVIDTAATWCEQLGTAAARELADDLRSLSTEVREPVRPPSRTTQARAASASSPHRPGSMPTVPPTTSLSSSAPPRASRRTR
ncbi:hypothetical protein GCM10010302_25330 [Streptomyces polychromogenes]|uniref:Uncharacterized protein n=1 Tax=Streptomyces polychromogenes TaxID=67342 RepID=A0ABP3EZ49_9ACTN